MKMPLPPPARAVLPAWSPAFKGQSCVAVPVRLLDLVASGDLTAVEFTLLLVLARLGDEHAGPRDRPARDNDVRESVAMLGEKIHRKEVTTRRLLAGLEAMGLLERIRDEGGQSLRQRYSLTPAIARLSEGQVP